MKKNKHPSAFTIKVSQCVKTQCKLSLSLNQIQLQAHLFGRVPVTLCQAAWHAGSTGHMCHQLSVWAPQTVSITKTHHPAYKSLFILRCNGKVLKTCTPQNARINECSTQQFHNQIGLILYIYIFNPQMKWHIHGFKWNSQKLHVLFSLTV